MPTTVETHESHTKRGRPYRVSAYTRYGPEHSEEWKRMVEAIRESGSAENPEAVATARLGDKSYTEAEQRKLHMSYSGRY